MKINYLPAPVRFFLFLLLTLSCLTPGQIHAQCDLQGLPPEMCLNQPPVTLSGVPTGCFTGTGVVGNQFFPNLAGPGIQTASYWNITGYQVDTIPFVPIAGGTLTSVSLADNQVSAPVPIGFNFAFFENCYDSVGISSNGFITFGGGTDDGCCFGPVLPDAATPHNLVALAWADFDPSVGGEIGYHTVGAAPNRTFIVRYGLVPHASGGGGPLSGEIHLFEGSNVIEIHTSALDHDSTNVTQGIEDATSSAAFTTPGRNGTLWSSLIAGDGKRWTPTGCVDTDSVFVHSLPNVNAVSNSPVCPGDTLFLDENGGAGVSWTWNGPNFGSALQNPAIPNASSANSGTYGVLVTDTNACTDTAFVQVVVEDSIAPTAQCMDVTVFLDMQGQATVAPAQVDGGSSDNCSIDMLSVSPNTFMGPGPNVVTLTVTDPSGNTASCQAIVTVQDTFVGIDPGQLVPFTVQAAPVPAADFVRVRIACDACALGGSGEMVLTDLRGRRITALPLQLDAGRFDARLDLSAVARGAYLLNVLLPEGRRTVRVLRE